MRKRENILNKVDFTIPVNCLIVCKICVKAAILFCFSSRLACLSASFFAFRSTISRNCPFTPRNSCSFISLSKVLLSSHISNVWFFRSLIPLQTKTFSSADGSVNRNFLFAGRYTEDYANSLRDRINQGAVTELNGKRDLRKFHAPLAPPLTIAPGISSSTTTMTTTTTSDIHSKSNATELLLTKQPSELWRQ